MRRPARLLLRRRARCHELPQLGDRHISLLLIGDKPKKSDRRIHEINASGMINHITAIRGRNPLVVNAVFARDLGDLIWSSGKASDARAGKRLELLREAVPGLRRLAILFDVGYPASLKESGEAQAAARATGLEITPLGIRRTDDIAPAFEALKVDALYVVDNALVTANRTLILALAVGMRLPTAFSGCEFVEAGGPMSYGPDYRLLFLRAAEYVDKILAGTKPGGH